MNLPLTSLIPTVISLSQFFANNFPNISWYPYWYLGTPFHYLIGPIVPILLSLLSKLLPLTLTQSYLLIIILSQLLTSVGLMQFLKNFGLKKTTYRLAGFLYLILPGGVLLLNFQNGLNHITISFMPFILILFQRYLLKYSLKYAILLTTLIAIALLTNIYSLLTVLVGIISLLLVLTPRKNWGRGLISISLITLLSLSLGSFWYTPKFYLILLSNPSFGGMPLLNLILSIFKYLLNFLPMILAVFVVKLVRFKPSQAYLQFALIFFGSFLTLTVVRFIADPDFVIDWIGFTLELQFAVAILLSSLFIRGSTPKPRDPLIPPISLISLITLIITSLFISYRIISSYHALGDYHQSVTNLLQNNLVPPQRIFLSGSPVFWINSRLNINQVRGGNDSAAINHYFNHATFQIREGSSSQLASQWLQILGVEKLLINDQSSQEYFHDFKNPDKFFDTQYFSLIDKNSGNFVFSINNSSRARLASETILTAKAPSNGADTQALTGYLANFKQPIQMTYPQPNQIQISNSTNSDQIISASISFDPNWQIIEGDGRVLKDPLGNLIIQPTQPGPQTFLLQYSRSITDLFLSTLLIVLSAFLLSKSGLIYQLTQRLTSKFSFGLNDSE